MTDAPDLDHLGAPNCSRCLVPMDARGEVRSIEADGVTNASGLAYWECPRCGLTRLS